MNNDLISRQAVIDHINEKREEHLESADLISRQAAILALAEQIMESALMDNPTAASTDIDRYRPIAELSLRDVPSAQRELLTDKEQRIFLAAMGREEKVCKQVDDEYRDCMEPYEDSLVRTCHEITRKVKGALWT